MNRTFSRRPAHDSSTVRFRTSGNPSPSAFNYTVQRRSAIAIMTSVPSSRAPNDPTFRVYSAEQAEQYATHRPGYPTHVIKFIVDHHRATGGQTGVLLDLGCGPGNSTRDLSPYFDVVVGADAGAAMIKKAQEMGGTTATGAPVQFCECAAEEIDGISGLPYGSVDIITAVSAVSVED
jgi:hypothetical protein